jgi:hypothetical protein
MKKSIFLLILCSFLCLAVPVFAQDDPNLADLARADGVTLHIESFVYQDSAGSFSPSNGVYLVMLMTIENPTTDDLCIRASNIRLLHDGDEYPPERALMGAVQRSLKPRRDYVGPLSGQCVDAGESEPSFAAFDVPADMDGFTVTFDDASQAFAGQGEIVAVESTATPADRPDPADVKDAQTIMDAISILAGGRDVGQVMVANGRAKGGIRTALITYTTHETEQDALVDEFMDILEAVASSIKVNKLDLDTVGLIVGSTDDKAIGVIEAQVDDLMDYHAGRITRAAFISKITFTKL